MTDVKKKPLSGCINCGMCNADCPTLKATNNELFGPRGRANMVNNNSSDESFYICTLCRACEAKCPLNLELDFRKERGKLQRTKANEEMIKNIRKYGNPIGELKDGKVPDELYCC
ncbi:4Fe-4S dicluster domain protein [Candidatus Tiddalikarchaeum anstoanum]|nr:4Fe-4S dicluster domain protein [Candidatus Tiddalikarchaeum anstoanum]